MRSHMWSPMRSNMWSPFALQYLSIDDDMDFTCLYPTPLHVTKEGGEGEREEGKAVGW